MKKLILFSMLFIALTAFTKKQSVNNIVTDAIVNGCGDDASPISSSCWSGCVSVPISFGSIYTGAFRQPTAQEYQQAQQQLDNFCNNNPMGGDPNTAQITG